MTPVYSAAMTLVGRIDADLKDAMRAREADRVSVLRMLKSALKYAAIQRGGNEEPADSEVVQVVNKQVKQREDSIAGYEQGGRDDLAAKERAEIEILRAYLPEPLSTEEIEALVRGAIAEAGASSMADMGRVMKAVTASAAGRADGKALSGEVKKQLS